MTLSEYFWYKDSYMKRLRLKNAAYIQVCNMIASYFGCDGFDTENIYPVYEKKEVFEQEEEEY